MENQFNYEWKATVSENASVILERDFEVLSQDKAFEAKELFEEFCEKFEKTLEVCRDKRFEVSGVAAKMGLDIHGKPSVELSDCSDGRCYVLCVFESEDAYQNVMVGDRILCRGNYLGVTNEFGVVLKRSEIL